MKRTDRVESYTSASDFGVMLSETTPPSSKSVLSAPFIINNIVIIHFFALYNSPGFSLLSL